MKQPYGIWVNIWILWNTPKCKPCEWLLRCTLCGLYCGYFAEKWSCYDRPWRYWSLVISFHWQLLELLQSCPDADDLKMQGVRPTADINKINSSPPGKNGHHFADDIFGCLFMNEKFCILIKISLNFVRMGPIDNKTGLVKIMAWHQIGDESLSEPMLTRFTDVYKGCMYVCMDRISFDLEMACYIFDTWPYHQPMMSPHHDVPQNNIQLKSMIYTYAHFRFPERYTALL